MQQKEAYSEEGQPTWRGLLEAGSKALSEAGVAEAELDAWYLLAAAFGMDRVHYYMEQNQPVRKERLEKGYGIYCENLKKRAERIPLQQILGNQEFMGMEFSVNEHVLIPRQDTETLVETVLREFPDPEISVLDMCTGSGCIAVSLAVLGGYRSVTAVDISSEALKVAKKNARRLFLIQRGTVRSQSFLVSDRPWRFELKTYLADKKAVSGAGAGSGCPGTGMLSEAGTEKAGRPGKEFEIRERQMVLLQSNLFRDMERSEQFDVIVSNPPYIPSAVIEKLEPEVRDHEPRIALDGQEDGLHFYRVLALECSRHLRTGGAVVFEIGYDQAEAVSRILKIAGYDTIETIKDEAGLDRVVKARWNK